MSKVTHHTHAQGAIGIPCHLVYCRTFVLILVLLLQGTSVWALPKAGVLEATRITTEEGLSNLSVEAIVQDETGFVWIGTQSGLNRYDGHEVRQYGYVPDDPGSLHSNTITALLIDSEGVLWVGTQGGGLHRYDAPVDRFIRVRADRDDWETLSDNSIWELFEDDDGYLWVGTSHGLNRLNRHTLRVKHRLFADENEPASLASNEIRGIVKDTGRNLWVGTNDGVHRMNSTLDGFVRYSLDPDQTGNPVMSQVTSMHSDEQGVLWVGTRGGGLWCYNAGNDRFYAFAPHDPLAYWLSEQVISDITEDAEGVLWLGLESGYLVAIDQQRRNVERYNRFSHSSTYAFTGSINALYASRDQVLWMGSFSGGAAWVDQKHKLASHVFSGSANHVELKSNLVTAFEQREPGLLWVGTDGGSLHLYDTSTGSVRSAAGVLPAEEHLPKTVLSLHKNEHTLLIGSYAEGLIMWNEQSQTLDRLVHDPLDSTSLSSDDVFVVYTDRSGTLWAGTNGGGLNSRSPGQTGFIRHVARLNDDSSLINNDVRSIFEDSNGVLWVGTYSGLLSRLDEERNHFEHYVINEPSVYYSSVVQAFLEDRQGQFWLATRGGGLLRFNRDTGRVDRRYTVDNGLPANKIHAIAEDEIGTLWMSTSRGVARLDTQTGAVVRFGLETGMQPGDFYPGSVFTDDQGSIYFGGFAGFNRFQPQELNYTRQAPEVVFTELLLANKTVAPSIADSTPLRRAIEFTDTLRLSHNDRVISLRYAALQFGDAARTIRYAYRLEGFDHGWNDAGNARMVTYTNLKPGSYRLLVRAAGSGGLWSEQPAELVILITPPFWQTAWFIGLVLVLVIFTPAAVSRYRLYTARKKNRDLERMVLQRTTELEQSAQVKDKLLAAMGHDLGNLSSVMGGSIEVLKKLLQMHRYDKALTKVHALEQNNLHFTNMLRDLMEWGVSQSGGLLRAPEPVDVCHIVQKATRELQVQAREKSVSLSVVWPSDRRLYALADEYTLGIVVRNLVQNAIKFSHIDSEVTITIRPELKTSGDLDSDETDSDTPQTELVPSGSVRSETVDSVALQSVSPMVIIEVRDQGVGMRADQIETILNGDKPASTAGTINERGTGLGLFLTRHFVKNIGGKLQINSIPGSGSTFRVQLRGYEQNDKRSDRSVAS